MVHCISEGLHIKLVLDWAMFLKVEQNNIEWDELYRLCNQFHLHRFLPIMNDIAVNTFKLNVTDPDIETHSLYTNKVLNSILYDEDFVFGSGEGSWHNRIHLITNLFKYRWKYNDIYQESILKQICYYVSGYFFHTED